MEAAVSVTQIFVRKAAHTHTSHSHNKFENLVCVRWY
jgi:hypothetical protein